MHGRGGACPCRRCRTCIVIMLLPLFRRQQVRCNSLRLRSQLPKLSLCWSYNDQISRSFLNPKALRDFSIDEVVRRLCTGQCTCHSMDPKFKCASATLPLPNGLTSGPHVLTLDPTICGCTELITMAAKGLNYIPIPALDLSAWSEQLRLVAVDFLAKLQQAFPGEHDVFCPEGKLLRLLHAWVDMQLQERRSGFTKIKLVKPDTLSVPATRSLSALQKSIYFCEVDKAPHQPCFICLDFAIVTLWQRLNSTDFRKMPDGEAERIRSCSSRPVSSPAIFASRCSPPPLSSPHGSPTRPIKDRSDSSPMAATFSLHPLTKRCN